MGRFIVIVLDGFGVGYMEDAAAVRPADVGANTWRHIADATPGLRLPRLEELGLMNIAGFETDIMHTSPTATWSKAALTHQGADTFWGHQEIMGTRPRKPVEEPFAVRLEATKAVLEQAGFRVEIHTAPQGGQLLVVNGAVTVADNIECDPGQAINVTAAIDDIPFEEVVKIGRIVRGQVFVSRVIAFGGRGVHLPQMLAAIEENPAARLIGVNAPASGVYNDDYHCVHMGYGVDPATQAATILPGRGVPVFLVGKVADIVENPQPFHSYSIVPTPEVMAKTLELIEQNPNAFICTNVQETDLSGHRENVAEYARILREADAGLAPILAALAPEDILVVMADHGNDPTIGHPHHTREYVPLMVRGGGLRPGPFPQRATLSDVGATVSDYFGAPAPENGTSFLPDLSR
jgi:phosphopentomutase